MDEKAGTLAQPALVSHLESRVASKRRKQNQEMSTRLSETQRDVTQAAKTFQTHMLSWHV